MNKYAPYRPDAKAGPLPENLAIRSAVPSDVDTIARLSQARDGGVLETVREQVAASLPRLAATGGLLLVADVGSIAGYGRVTRFVPPPGAPRNAAPEGPYLGGIIVDPAWRRRGIATALTRARLAWIDERDPASYYFTNVRNEASIALHAPLGFVELTRDFWHPNATFDGGVGILFRRLTAARLTAAPRPSRA